ncbi:hypothetical protein [Pseudoroseicyclus aestuarii]|uniref:Uncharacterized protein n=1 Tax=Pseudoroseicyclus aestuarii TaxID=1795041 RepID=A0A318SQU2_9RHOB|nr:hypothetical protein [Pseudoroseicyclus aestuarii]PYE84301.1 hypothetical protein DFP88_10297 [Pseudoroseicyclus aestuarii]
MTRGTAYLIRVLAILALVWALAARAGTASALEAGLLAGVVAAPLWLTLAYLASVRRAHFLSLFEEGAPWRGWLSGWALRLVLAVPLALWAGATLLADAVGRGALVTVDLGLAALAMPLGAWAATRMVGPALKPFARPAAAIWGGSLLAAVLLTALRLAVGVAALPGALSSAVAAQGSYHGPSALVAWITDAAAILSGAEAAAAGYAGRLGWGLPVTLWQAAAGFAYYLGLALIFGACLLRRAELRRLFGASADPVPPPLRRGQVALAGFIAVLALAVLAEGLALGERAAGAAGPQVQLQAQAPGAPGAADLPALPGQEGAVPRLPGPARLRQAIEAERIADAFFAPGTTARLEALRAEVQAEIDAADAQLGEAMAAGFDAARGQVPAFLDWYYSLPAEYLRTGHLLIGDAEAYLQDRFTETVLAGGAFDAAQAQAAQARALAAEAAARFEAQRAALLADPLNLPEGASVQLVAPPLGLPTLPEGAIALPERLALSGAGGLAGGALAGAIGAKVMAKLSAKGTVKLAAQALAKLAGGKLVGGGGGAAAGALAGGTIGSVVPGAGTVVGAFVGGVIGGVTVSLGVDYLLLSLEEQLGRAEFEAQILDAIDEAEAEVGL